MADEKKILVIEDHPDTLMLMSLVLQREGFNVAQASNGNDALQQLKGGLQPDLVFVDLRMPGCDGIEFMQRFRQMPSFEETPVYVTSGAGDIEDCVKDCGAQGYLEKPIDLAKLIDQVGQVFAHESPTS